MGKVVEVTNVCDATNCGKEIDDPADAINVEVRVWSDANPGVTRFSGVLDESHANLLQDTLTGQFGLS